MKNFRETEEQNPMLFCCQHLSYRVTMLCSNFQTGVKSAISLAPLIRADISDLGQYEESRIGKPT